MRFAVSVGLQEECLQLHYWVFWVYGCSGWVEAVVGGGPGEAAPNVFFISHVREVQQYQL